MKKVLVALVAIIALAAVGVGAFLLLKSSPDKPAAAEAAKAQEAPRPAAPKPAGTEASKAPPAKLRLVVETPRPAGAAMWRIELASFGELDPAKDFQAEMTRRDLGTEIVEILDITGRSWYHVRVGSFTDQEQAEARLPGINRIAGIAGVVTKEIPSPPPRAPSPPGQ